MLTRLGGQRWRGRLIIASMVLTGLILAGVSVYSYWIYQGAMADLVTENDRQYAFVSAARLQGELTKFSDELLLLARDPDILQDNPNLQRSVLREAKHRLSIFDGGVVLLDNFGRVQATEPDRSDIRGADWSDRDFFRELLASPRARFSGVIDLGVGRSEVVMVSVPILGENQEFLGALVGMFRLGDSGVSPLYASIVRLRIGQTGSTYLVDQNGRILYDSDQVRLGETLPLPEVGLVRGQGDAQRLRDPDGNDVIAAFAPVPGTPWTLVVEDDWSVVTDKTLNYARNLLGILAMGIILPVLGVALFIRAQNSELLERERLDQEQRVAALIQQRVLPRALPMLPGWSLAVFHKPVNTPGQDFYDALLLEDGQLMLVAGHVSEEGLAAAHVLSTTRAALRGAARMQLSPSEALQYCNSLLCPEMQADRCVTVVYAVLDAWSGQLRMANAGFNPPWLDNGGGLDTLQITGSPLGIAWTSLYQEGQAYVQPGHCAVFYSQGIVTARNKEGEEFGLERLRALVDGHDCAAEAIAEALEGEFGRFLERGGTLPDDLTVLVVQRLPTTPPTAQAIGRPQAVRLAAPEFDVD